MRAAAALIQDAVGFAVERSRRRVGAFGAAYDALGVFLDAVRDQLPLRNLGRGPHAPELLAEGAHSRIGPQRGIAPGLEPRRQIARQAVEAHLLLGAQQKLDQLPRLLLAPRLVTEHKTRPTRQRVARLPPGRPRPPRRRPRAPERGRKARRAPAQSPGTWDGHAETAAGR